MSLLIIRTVAVDTSRGLRIWMEGNKLAEKNWVGGTKYRVEYYADEIALVRDESGKRAVTSGSRAGKPRPIIELRSKKNDDVFFAGDELLCTISINMISIMRAK